MRTILICGLFALSQQAYMGRRLYGYGAYHMSSQPSGTDFQRELHTLYADHHGWIYDWLRRRLGCASSAADLAHDTFLRVLSQRGRSDRIETTIRQPRAYLTTIAHGLLVNHVRRRDIERAYLETLAATAGIAHPSLEERAIIIETLLQIDRLLDGLPVPVRRAFLLAQLEGWSYAQIAADLGVSTSSVKQYLRKATVHCLCAVM